MLDLELESWPIEPADRARIRERRISMFGRTDWEGYPKGFPPFGRTGSLVTLTMILPAACVATVVGLLLSGNPMAAFAFGCTFIAEAGILAIIYRSRRRLLHRAAAAELGHPVCLGCGFYNLGHHRGDVCCECGCPMPSLPDERFPPPEEIEELQMVRQHRRRLPMLRMNLP